MSSNKHLLARIAGGEGGGRAAAHVVLEIGPGMKERQYTTGAVEALR